MKITDGVRHIYLVIMNDYEGDSMNQEDIEFVEFLKDFFESTHCKSIDFTCSWCKHFLYDENAPYVMRRKFPNPLDRLHSCKLNGNKVFRNSCACEEFEIDDSKNVDNHESEWDHDSKKYIW